MLPNGGTQEVWGQTIGADAYPCALTSDNKVIRDYTNLGWHNHTNGTTEDNCPNCVKTPKHENGVYQISTIQELYWFSAYVNNTDSSIKAELANNITVNEDTIGDTVKNCYFQSDSTDTNARTEKQFKSGEVAELLNICLLYTSRCV